MSESGFDLEKLIGPVGTATFFKDYWEKRPLEIFRGDPRYYAGLLTIAELDQIIAFTRPKFVDLDAFSTKPPRPKTYVQGWLADDPPKENAPQGVADVLRVIDQGKTLVIRAMQHRCAPAAHLCRRLESVFHCPVHANLYLTPEGAQGFDAHFDTHEVFVLQLEGTKTWRLYGSGRAFPLVEERLNVPKDRLGEPREVRLEAGDLLYLPRGYVHEAFTSENASLHLTIGVNVFRWADLMHAALDEAARWNERLRESIPPGELGGGDLPADLKERFRETLEVMTREIHLDEGLRGLGDQFFGRLTVLPNGRFARSTEDRPLDLDTILEKSHGAICRVVRNGDWIAIEFPGGQVGGPLKIASALEFIAKTDRFSIRDLPDDLSGESKLVLAKRLLSERLLTISPRPEEHDGTA